MRSIDSTLVLSFGMLVLTSTGHAQGMSGGMGGMGSDGGGATEYTGTFSEGAFIFDDASIVLELNSKGNLLQNKDEIILTRQVGENEEEIPETVVWDNYFNGVCGNLLGSTIVPSITVAPGKLTVEAAGEGDRRVIMRDVELPSADGRGAKVTPQVIDNGPIVPLPGIFPADGDSVTFYFESGSIYGRSNKGGPGGSQGCQEAGGGTADVFVLDIESVLTISNPAEP